MFRKLMQAGRNADYIRVMNDEEKQDEVNEPQAEYRPAKKSITFFNSFDQAEQQGREEMKSHSPMQRMINLEILRKRLYKQFLTADGKWPLPKKIITIEKGEA